MNDAVSELIARSNRLGADPRNTNYAGGNTSAKGAATDPATGARVELLWVKGSGGDLGTLTESGLAVLRLDRLRGLVDVYPGEAREDEMVAAFDYCLHGRGGAAPSIDTAMHGLVTARTRGPPTPGLGHRLRDRGRRRGAHEGVLRRPGALGSVAASGLPARPRHRRRARDAHPEAIGVILGGHGITAWGPTSAECEANSLEIIRTAQAFIDERGRAEPFGPLVVGYEALTAAGAPCPGGRARPIDPRPGEHRSAAGRPLHRHGPSAGLPFPATASGSRRAGYVLP